MSAIEFVVRNAAGALQRGFVGGDTGSPLILAQAGSDISLNLSRAAISAYRQDGDALRITLTNGEVITIDDYFGPNGQPVADLFISTDGLLSKVDLAAGADGAQFANYVDQDVFGKWSPDDDLYFVGGEDVAIATPYAAPADDQVGMLAAGLPLLGGMGLPILGLLGLGAGAAVLGGGGEKGEEGPVVHITTGTVNSTNTVVNEVDQVDGATVTGTGTVGGTITVVVNGHTETTTVNSGGTWTVTIPPSVVVPGTYVTGIEVTITNEHGSAKVIDNLRIDTEVNVTFNAEITGGEGIVNAVEQDGRVTLSGTVDAGATVTVTLNGQTFTATVTGTSWTLLLPAGFLPEGAELTQSASVTAVDEFGNTTTVTGSFHIDTVLNLTFNAAATGGNGIVNATEEAGVVTLSGSVDTDATSVTVLINGQTFNATISGGAWTLALPAGFLPEGETITQSATVTAVDDAGNTTSVTGSFVIDTVMNVAINPTPAGGDFVVNHVEQGGVVTLTGTVDANPASLVVTVNGTAFTNAVVTGTTWTLALPAGFLPGNNVERVLNVGVSATDANGNTASATGTVELDTWVNTLTQTAEPGGADGIINRAEGAAGLTLTGAVEYNAALSRSSTVSVTLVTDEGVTITRAATVTGGTWTLHLAPGELPAGEYGVTATINATDHAGNTRSLTETFTVDTVAPDAPLIEVYARDGANNTVVGFTIPTTDDNVDVARVHNGTAVEEVDFAKVVSPFNPAQTLINFASDPAPNGSHLVLTAEDTAGNHSSTLFVLEETSTNVVNVTAPGYDAFDIEAIDLRFAQDSSLTLTAADLESLSAHSNTLTIHGGADDVVNVIGATDSGANETIGGRSYSVYHFGSNGGTLLIEDGITVHI